ncbi:MAG: hypothetical protein AAF682_29865 [Planctomycetota bacterium]
MKIQRGMVMLLAAVTCPPSAGLAQGDVDVEGVMRNAHGVYVDTEGAVHGHGPGYLTRFGARGPSFLPALGPDAERAMPLELELHSARRGDVELDASLRSGPKVDGAVVTYDRGTDQLRFVERYDVLREGIEQSFVFPELPGEGDLVVRVAYDTPLSLTRADAEGLRFEHADLGGVAVGAVTGIDARGRTVPGRLRLDGDVIEMMLPASFVDTAEFPLVLDPLIGVAFTIGNEGDRDRNPDVAYDAGLDRYLVIWERVFSADRVLLMSNFVSDLGTFVPGLPITLNDVSLNPSVATIVSEERYIVAYQQGPSVIGPWRIKATVVSNTGVPLETIDVTGANNPTDPDVGGDRRPGGNEALLVWDDSDDGILGSMLSLDASGGLVDGPPFAISATGLAADHPAVSKSSGDTGTFAVAWERDFITDTDIRVAAVTSAGTVGTEQLIPFTLESESAPDLDGDGEEWLLVYERTEELPNPERDILAQRLTVDATTLSFTVGAEIVVDANEQDDESDPAVAFTGQMFVVAYSDDNNAFDFQSATVMERVTPEGDFCGLEEAFSTSSSENVRPSLASKFSGGQDGSDKLLAVWEEIASVFPLDSNVKGHLALGIGEGGPVTDLGGGCGNGGTVDALGPFALGNQDFVLRLTGADPAATACFLNIAVPAPPIVCGGCAVTPFGLTFALPIVGGQSLFSTGLPCDASSIGATVQAQWTVFGGVEAPCAGPGLAFSNRLELVLSE